jgi:hypothetical protein
LDDTPILAEDVRLRLGELLRDWKEPNVSLAQSSKGLAGHGSEQHEAADAYLAAMNVEVPRGGKRRLPPDFWAKVATVYLAAVTDGNRRPSLAVKEWGDSNGNPISASGARAWVRRAAEKGLLPKGQPGKVRTEEDK